MFEGTRSFLNQLTDVPYATLEWKRRGRVLNVILIAFVIGAIVGIVLSWLAWSQGESRSSTLVLTVGVLSALIASNVILFVLNRRVSVSWASGLFLLILIILFFLADSAQETVWGRNMIPLALPIVMAGLILPPAASFIAAGIISVGAVTLAISTGQAINTFGVLAYISLALISWLTTWHLERAVLELNQTNQELDQRVVKRTEELSYANSLLEEERELLEDRVVQRTAEISNMNKELIQMSRVKDEFLASMSHELRTPLNAIIGYSEALLEDAQYEFSLEDEQVKDIDRILNSGRHLLHLINDILDLSKLEANQTSVNYEELKLASLINKLTETILPAMSKQDNVFSVENNFDAGEIVGDEYKLVQILLNLLSNAAKFTEKGTITLKIDRFKEDLIVFKVIDSGIGIPDDAFAQIFEPFRQVENTKARSFDGTGLGLAISQKLANAMGGEITVQSQVGVGSTFTLILPTNIHLDPNMMDGPVHQVLSLN